MNAALVLVVVSSLDLRDTRSAVQQASAQIKDAESRDNQEPESSACKARQTLLMPFQSRRRGRRLSEEVGQVEEEEGMTRPRIRDNVLVKCRAQLPLCTPDVTALRGFVRRREYQWVCVSRQWEGGWETVNVQIP